MRRRSLILALALIVLLFGGAAIVLFLVVDYEPDVYAKARPPEGALRGKEGDAFLSELSRLTANASNADRDWYVQFKDEQINSYLEGDFVEKHLASRFLPNGVSRPHFVFERDKIHVAFRYASGGWNPVISIDLRVWLARGEVNAVALELEGLRAGALPISGQWLLEEIAKAARESGNGIDVTWYRLNGHPVALIRFQVDQAHPTLLLQDVHVDQGSLTIRGRSTEAALHALLLNWPPGGLWSIAD
jgi:hypothetical protein